MTFDDDLQAWISDTSIAPECPMCGSPLDLGWNDCRCGLELNVEVIRNGGDDGVYLVTQEHDEMRELINRVDGRSSYGAAIAGSPSYSGIGEQVALL